MKCEDIERLILLGQTGELSEKDFQKLERHLAECERCHEYEDDADHLLAVARKSLPSGEPSRTTLAAIRAAAEERASRRHVIRFQRLAVHALAYAAAVMIAVTGWVTLWPNGRQDRIEEISAIIDVVAEADTSDAEIREVVENDDELRALANELLRMEGFLSDDFAGFQGT